MPRRRYIFDPPDRFVAGTVGEPGERTFFLQAREGSRIVSVVLEKVQVAVLAERLGALLDELVVRGIAASDEVPAASAPDGDMDDYLASLASLRGRGYRTLFPSHGAPILEVDAKLDEYREHRLERERQILAAWQAGAREPAQIVATVYAEVAEAARPLAERQATAHLERLRRQGRL